MESPVKAANNYKNKASGLAIFFGNTVLLAKRSKNCYITGEPAPFGGYWSIFAGALEKGERHQECAVREVLEEAEIKIDSNKLKYINTIVNDKTKLRIYGVESEEMLYPKLNPEHTAYGWFNIDTLDSFSEKIDPKVVKSVIKYAKKRKK